MSFLQSLKVSLENEELLDENGEVMEVTDADIAEADAEFAEGEALRQQAERDLEQAERAEAVVEELEGTNEAIRASVDNGTFTREAAAMVEAQRRTAAVALNLDPEEGAGEQLVDNPGLESMVFNQGVIALEQNEGMIAKIRKTISAIVDKVIAGYEKVKLFFQKLFNYLPSQIKTLKERWSKVKPEDISDELVKELNDKYKDKLTSLRLDVRPNDMNDLLLFVKTGKEYINKLSDSDVYGAAPLLLKFIKHEFGNELNDGAYMTFGNLKFFYEVVKRDGDTSGSFKYLRDKATEQVDSVKSSKGLYEVIDRFVNVVDGKYTDIKKIDSISNALTGKIKALRNSDKSLKREEKSKYMVWVEGTKNAATICRAIIDIEQGLLSTIRDAVTITDKVISKATGKKEETKETA